MNSKPIGEIVSEHVRLSNDFKLWVENEIFEWANEQPEDNDDYHYLVNIKRSKNMEDHRQFHCDLQLFTNDHIFSSIREGKSPQRALRHCLGSLHKAA
ncbi:MAG: hypothetical protein AABZ06_08090 [Bdellovibrionota bacterium]